MTRIDELLQPTLIYYDYVAPVGTTNVMCMMYVHAILVGRSCKVEILQPVILCLN
jgi:hypothetical protein